MPFSLFDRLLPPWAWALFALGLVSLMTAGAADRVLSLDDIYHVRQYPQANAGLPLLKIICLRHWQTNNNDSLWRPATKALWSLSPKFGFSTLPWAALTAALAAACAGAFAAALARRDGAKWTGAFALLPFVHPLASDVLFPFVAQADLIAAAGTLAAWACWRRASFAAWLSGAGFFALACFSKESAYPAALAIPAALLCGPGSRPLRRKLALRALIAAGGIIAVRVLFQAMLFGALSSPAGDLGALYKPGERTLSILEIAGRYAVSFFAPRIPQTDYSFLKQPGSTAGIHPAAGLLAGILIIIVLLLLARLTPAARQNARHLRARREMAGGIIWTVLFLSPYFQIIPIGALWGARFAFLPLFGAAWAASAFALHLREAGPRFYKPCLLVLLAAGAWGFFLNTRHAADWVSPLALWRSEVAREPRHAYAWKNLAASLQEKNRTQDAWEAVNRAARLWPDYGPAHQGIGRLAWAMRRPELAEQAMRDAIRLMPGNPEPCVDLAKMEAAQGRFQEARGLLEKTLAASPDCQEAREILGSVQSDIAKAKAGGEPPPGK